MDKINKELDALERKLTKSNKIAAKGDKLSLGDAIKLGRKSSSMEATLRKATKEYATFQPTDKDAKHVLARMTTIQGLSEEQLNLMIQDRPTLEKLRVAGLVKKNIVKTHDASAGLAKMTVGKAPPEIKAEADALEAKSNAAFVKATAAFDGATGGEEHEGEGDDSD